VAAETVILLLAFTLLAAGFVIWQLPIATCPQCAHCASEKLAKEREEEALAGRFYGIPLCPACGRHHGSEEPHRR
jgi:hypothetical protein